MYKRRTKEVQKTYFTWTLCTACTRYQAPRNANTMVSPQTPIASYRLPSWVCLLPTSSVSDRRIERKAVTVERLKSSIWVYEERCFKSCAYMSTKIQKTEIPDTTVRLLLETFSGVYSPPPPPPLTKKDFELGSKVSTKYIYANPWLWCLLIWKVLSSFLHNSIGGENN